MRPTETLGSTSHAVGEIGRGTPLKHTLPHCFQKAKFKEKIEEGSKEIRGDLAEDFGGDPDDYRHQPVADGGE